MEKPVLKIDPEFRDKIPPLTPGEFDQLKENILQDGEVYEPIVTWNDTIIDGHNRWKIICENWESLKDKFRVKQMDFADKWEAFEWMYRKQLGRRNLTDEQKTYMIGKMYEARKKSVGGNGSNQHKKEQFHQNDEIAIKGNNATAKKIAAELGIGKATVERAEKFAKGVDAIKDISPEAAEKVLSGTSTPKKDIADFVKMEPEQKAATVEGIISGVPAKRKSYNPAGYNKEMRENREETEKIVAEMYNPDTVPEYTIDFLLESIEDNGENYAQLLKNTLLDRSTLLTTKNKPKVVEAINGVIRKIEKIREAVKR